MSMRKWILVLVGYALATAFFWYLSPTPRTLILGIGLGLGIGCGVFGICLAKSHRQWKEQAELTDQAIELSKTLLVQRDEVGQKLTQALDLIRRYQDERHSDGEEWKNG